MRNMYRMTVPVVRSSLLYRTPVQKLICCHAANESPSVLLLTLTLTTAVTQPPLYVLSHAKPLSTRVRCSICAATSTPARSSASAHSFDATFHFTAQVWLNARQPYAGSQLHGDVRGHSAAVRARSVAATTAMNVMRIGTVPVTMCAIFMCSFVVVGFFFSFIIYDAQSSVAHVAILTVCVASFAPCVSFFVCGRILHAF